MLLRLLIPCPFNFTSQVKSDTLDEGKDRGRKDVEGRDIIWIEEWFAVFSYLMKHVSYQLVSPGILISIRLSLGLSGQNWMRSVSLRDDWWEAQISLSMLTLMFCVLFTLFPRRMEGYKEFDEKEYNCKLFFSYLHHKLVLDYNLNVLSDCAAVDAQTWKGLKSP